MTREAASAIEAAAGISLGKFTERPVAGGCIHDARLLTAESGERWFVKLNTADRLEMFEAESAGLDELRNAAAIRVPEPVATGLAGTTAFLVLEALELTSRGDSAAMGRQLADLHRHSPDSAMMFGWRRDNFIGATPQANPWTASWGAFFAESRLEPQLRLARNRGKTFDRTQQLLARVDELVGAHEPTPSLLHGDLWGGNAGFDSAGEPVIFDPAVYFGDREAELAFTRMFGGFSPVFYEAYQESWPLPDGWKERESIYNLYHVLNHFNLFGGGYASQAQSIINRFA